MHDHAERDPTHICRGHSHTNCLNIDGARKQDDQPCAYHHAKSELNQTLLHPLVRVPFWCRRSAMVTVERALSLDVQLKTAHCADQKPAQPSEPKRPAPMRHVARNVGYGTVQLLKQEQDPDQIVHSDVLHVRRTNRYIGPLNQSAAGLPIAQPVMDSARFWHVPERVTPRK